MRYYKIAIDGGKTYESTADGKNLPGALQVELDIPVSSFATPGSYGGYVKIWGVPLSDIWQAADNAGKNISVYGGMAKGLPLSNPSFGGLLASGTINKAFGNWVDLEQSLDLIFFAESGTWQKPKNIVVTWLKGANLSDAVVTALKTAFGADTKITNNVNRKITSTESQSGYYQSVGQFQAWVLAASLSAVTDDPNYTGIEIFVSDGAFTIFDGSTQKDPIEIAFQDLIGQPTWIATKTVQFKTAMRADLTINDYIKFPQGAITTTTSSGAVPAGGGINQKTSFQGVFRINDVHHFGSSRQPDAYAWNTTFSAFAV